MAGDDPKVPPGRDPGGIAVALIGAGIDYTVPDLARKLARDGEGEIIGYDYTDDDRRPFAAADAQKSIGVFGATDVAMVIVRQAPSGSLIAIRAGDGNVIAFAKALWYASQSPAQVITIARPFVDGQLVTLVAAAARKDVGRLYVIAAGDDGIDLDQRVPANARAIPNLIVVTAATGGNGVAQSANHGRATVDMATAGATSLAAMANVAALAVRSLAMSPHIRGPGLKALITSLAVEQTGAGRATRTGIIAAPEHHFAVH